MYIEASAHLRRAINKVTAAGYLVKNILGTGFTCELIVHTHAGYYICSAETALINSLEDRRANPHFKPSFPASSASARGKLTCLNNVETLCNVPAILANNVAWYTGISNSENTGTNLLGFSSRIKIRASGNFRSEP